MKTISLGRHKRNCSICKLALDKRRELEDDFCDWQSPSILAKRYHVTRDSIYRHARAYRLNERRNGNLRAALGRIVQHVDEVEITASSIVSAIVAMSRINLSGEFIPDPQEYSLDKLFGTMTSAELLEYARSGRTPAWWQSG